MIATSPRSRATVRMAALGGACVLAVVTLTGCIKVDADLAINADATGTGSLAFELQKQAAQFMGISDLDTFKTEIKSGDIQGEGLTAFTSCEPSENDTGFVYTCTFTDEAFTDPKGPWTIAKTGDTISFHMANAGQTDTQTSDAAALLGDASLGSIAVKVAFPGPITEVTGSGVEKTSDTTATVSGTLTSPLDVTITSESGGGGPKIAALLVVLGALAVLALIVIVVVVLIVRRRRPPDGEDAATTQEAPVASETPVEADADTTSETPVEAEAPVEADAATTSETPVASETPAEPIADAESDDPSI